MTMLLERVRASIEEATRAFAAREEELQRPKICPGCGIDLPSTWHWDNCPRDLEHKQGYEHPFDDCCE